MTLRAFGGGHLRTRALLSEGRGVPIALHVAKSGALSACEARSARGAKAAGCRGRGEYPLRGGVMSILSALYPSMPGRLSPVVLFPRVLKGYSGQWFFIRWGWVFVFIYEK